MGMKAICLHGHMSQAQRLGALSGFKAGPGRASNETKMRGKGGSDLGVYRRGLEGLGCAIRRPGDQL